MQNKYDSYAEGGEQSYDTVELRMTPYATIRGEFNRAFGTESEFGQSLGVNMTNVQLVDGVLYYYPNKDVYKLFSWKEVTGFSPSEKLGRGETPELDDADEVHVENYGQGTQTYEIVAARLPEIVDDDGDTVVEAASKVRQVQGNEDGTPEFTEWDDLGGEFPEFRDIIMWNNGSEDYGPNTVARNLLETLTVYGSDAVVDEDDLYNWLPDTSGNDILRDDLREREVDFFMFRRESKRGYTYSIPVVEDVSTGEEVQPSNRADAGGSGNESSGESEEVQAARTADAGEYPEPVADYVSTGRRLNLTNDRARNLLESLVEDGDNALTESMVEDCGGFDQLISEVI